MNGQQQEAALSQELKRRIDVIQSDEAGDESHRALTSTELWTAWIIVFVTLAIGLVVSL
ncbi:MAG: hypothetical protein JHC62_01655 [Microbacteriaceae bacterium]|jgi:hypothetical protein|nr:hypothetical protein [Microbacteriaceae bacterium]